MEKKTLPIWKKLNFFKNKEVRQDGWSEVVHEECAAEAIYRQRFSHDKVVRTTHGVNCTGSCSWKVFVKDGIITSENQQTDYPSTGPDMPEFEPRGCPRGASFSWYVYSPLRIKHPYIRRQLLSLWREALKNNQGDAVKAWGSIVEDAGKSKQYKEVRGKGGLVRGEWQEVNQIMSAMLLYTIQTYGPDRIAGFTPIPAMSMVSYAAGARFLSLLGAPMLSFYDWYADLPPASPQIWGEQTDVPESSDWYNAGYIMMWGSNIPMTRTPDAHFMTEVRYKGTKVVAVSPDYAENVKFADNWLPVNPGSDAALAQAMTHVILKEFYVEKQEEYFINYAKEFTDMPFLVLIDRKEDGYTPGRFLRASDLGITATHGEWKPMLWDTSTDAPALPNGTIGQRWDGTGKWNLKMENEAGEALNPLLTFLGVEDETLCINLPEFAEESTGIVTRGIPVKMIMKNGKLLRFTTVFDLMLAQYGVARNLPGEYPENYEDEKTYTPSWQEKHTNVTAELVIQIAREFAQNAADTKGRSMIIMGAGINHWFNGDTIYRAILNLVILTGCQGVNGGGWAHYVGQEKCRPIEGWGTVAFARDWSMPPRLQNATSFFYFATNQWKYETHGMDSLKSPTVEKSRYSHPADYNALAARLGWMPSYPQFNQNSLELSAEAAKAGAETTEQVMAHVVKKLKDKTMTFAVEDPNHAKNHPRGLFVWRSNLISSSGKGHEYFLKYLLGASHGLLSETNEEMRPTEIQWSDNPPEGKLDLLVDLDFRMAGTALYSDIVLPAATWYEKTDLSSTDMHPFVHPFNPAINPPWEAKSDWDIFKGLAETFSEMAKTYLPEVQKDIVAVPLMHDSPGEMAQPFGRVLDWRRGEAEPIPGKTMPNLVIVERDYKEIYTKFTSLGPLLEKNTVGAHGIAFSVKEQYEELKKINGNTEEAGIAFGRPKLVTARHAVETMLTLSSATNGKLAMKAWEDAEKKTGMELKQISAGRAGETFTFNDITAQPRQVIPTPVFTGSNQGDKRYSPFTTSIDHKMPFRTLTGRQHFYIDHEIMMEFGETMPVYKPTLSPVLFAGKEHKPPAEGKEVILRYLTPHGKWNIHSTYQDNLHMLTLFRGGPHVWVNHQDALQADLKDNDWVEVYNRNGVVAARVVVSHRMPRGTLYMYHAQDRHINVPGSKITGQRGGTHNSPTRVHVKPTQCIGGYAQLSYGFNYYGPIGNQRDIYVAVRKLKEVSWLED